MLADLFFFCDLLCSLSFPTSPTVKRILAHFFFRTLPLKDELASWQQSGLSAEVR